MIQHPCREVIPLLPGNTLLGFEKFADVRRITVAVLVSVKLLPGCQEQRIVWPRHIRVGGGFQVVAAGQGVEIVVLLARGQHFRHVRVIIQCFDFVDLAQQIGIRRGLGEHGIEGQKYRKHTPHFHVCRSIE